MVRARQACAVALLGLVSTVILLTAIRSHASKSQHFDKPQTSRMYSDLPVNFVENAGQTDARVKFYAHGAGFAFYLTAQEAVFQFASQSLSRTTPLTTVADRSQTTGAILRLRFVDRGRRGTCGRGRQLSAWRRRLALAAGLVAIPAGGLP